ncbi:MAG: 4Fe-4S dicluster domain-containing protein [Candidatus Paceibacterota bacterium]|jgi:ferredoxin
MAIVINFKICDNAKECGGIAACSTGALSWDEKKKKIKIDNSKCLSCGKCEKACAIGAIKVAKNEKQYARFKKEIDDDLREASDLFIDRYGAQPIHPAFLTEEREFDLDGLQSKRKTAVEVFNDDSIMCLLLSIPIKELIGEFSVNYLKLKIDKGDLLKKYKILKLPALLFFDQGKMVGKIEGYYDKEQGKELRSKIAKILK